MPRGDVLQMEGPQFSPQYLPWGAIRERMSFPENMSFKQENKSGEVVMQMLFAEFALLADRKIDQVLHHCVSFMLYLKKKTLSCVHTF